MNDARNVSVGKPKIGGAIFRAPLGTELPKDAITELPDAFKGLGYVSTDGLVNSNTSESGEVAAWGGDTVANPQGAKKDTFKFTLIESLNAEVLRTVHGDENVSGDLDAGIEIKVNGTEKEACSWVVDMILKGGVLKRIVVPNATVISVGDVTYKDDTPIGYEVTISASANSEGDTHYEYIKRNAAAVAEEAKEEENNVPAYDPEAEEGGLEE